MTTFAQGWRETWRRLLTDSGARLLLVAAPILYSLFYPLPYLGELVREVPVAVVDLDHSSLSRQLVRFADAHENLRVVARFDSLAAAEAAVGLALIIAMHRQFKTANVDEVNTLKG